MMDADTARYLLAALIQAVTVTWALAIAIYVFAVQRFRLAYDAEMAPPRNLNPDMEKKWFDLREKSVMSFSSRMVADVGSLAFMSGAALLSILLAVYTLSSIQGESYPEALVDLTVGLSGGTFLIIFLQIVIFVRRTFKEVVKWTVFKTIELEQAKKLASEDFYQDRSRAWKKTDSISSVTQHSESEKENG